MVQAVILTHGIVGKSLLEAVERVLGPQTGVDVVTTDSLSLEQITEAATPRVQQGACVLFVDFCGGAPYLACRALDWKESRCALLSGVNMPMLISFFTKRDRLPFDELVETVKADGLRGIQLLTQ